MRTEPPSPLASAFARLRAPAGRARRWLAARGPVTRIALLLAALGALGAAGYLASVDDPSARSWAWLFEGRRLSADDLTAIAEALEAEGIPHGVDHAGRVGVRPDRKAEALAALAKRHKVPPTLDELSNADDEPRIWDGPDERERRDKLRLERTLKLLIEGLDPAIASAHVRIHRVKARGGLGAPSVVSAFIHLRTRGGRRLGHHVVEGIELFLRGQIPDLKPEAITVADQAANTYLAAGDPARKQENQEKDWRDAITDGLRHIPDVGVSVLLEAVAVPAPPPDPPPPLIAEEVVRPNGSVVIEPDPAPASPAPPPPPRTRANVWVRIPRSFYLRAFQAQSPGRHPTPEDLKPMQSTTEKLVHDAVEAHIPRDLLGEVKIDNVQDDLANPRTLLIPPAPESGRTWPWLALSGAVVVPAALAGAAALVRIATRRPAARPSRSAWRPGYVADGPGGPVPGPSEKVRELIRLNSTAAAGVLQRWIGQAETQTPAEPSTAAAPAEPGGPDLEDLGPLRKAAILVVSLEQPLASQLLAQLDRAAVEAVTLEIARLERIAPEEQRAVLEEFYGLGLRRLRFVFEDLVKMDDKEIREAYHAEDAPTWALALVGAARPVGAKVLGALAPGAADDLRRRIARFGPFHLDQTEAAQADLADRLRRLHDHGQLTLPDPSGQEAILV
jgi:flagellar motor switch protein FliG